MPQPVRPQKRAAIPEPGETRAYPWRFTLGQGVYVLGHAQTERYTVIGGELWIGCPHLRVLDVDGNAWRIPQLHASSKPIAFRKA